jgi:hypothetical protein
MKIKIFKGYSADVEKNVNAFLVKNQDKVILDIKHSAGDKYYVYMTIIYCDKFEQQNIEGKYALK